MAVLATFSGGDAQGFVVLNIATGRGQTEVVKTLITSFNFIASVVHQVNLRGNQTAAKEHGIRFWLNCTKGASKLAFILLITTSSITSVEGFGNQVAIMGICMSTKLNKAKTHEERSRRCGKYHVQISTSFDGNKKGNIDAGHVIDSALSQLVHMDFEKGKMSTSKRSGFSNSTDHLTQMQWKFNQVHIDGHRTSKDEYIYRGATQNSILVAQWMPQIPGATSYIGCIGKDKFREEMKKNHTQAGVKVHYYEDMGALTWISVVSVVWDERSLITNLSAANCYKVEHLKRPENWALFEKEKYIYIAGFFLTDTSETIQLIVEHAAANNKVSQ